MEYLNNDFISFEVKDIGEGITLIHFELKRQLEPQELKNINPPDPVKNKFSKNIVVLLGRAPNMVLWVFSAFLSSSKSNCYF
jgi:CRISPR-associated protein Csx3